MSNRLNRRQFVSQAGLAGAVAGLGATTAPAASFFKRKAKELSPNDKLNIGVIGTANRALANLRGVGHENIVALCDVDENFLAAAAKEFPKAAKFSDFRDLIDHRGLDAVVVSTPDHTHAVATAAALKSGLHVYCEKPLTHTVSEAREIRNLAAGRPELATQMGNQIHASNNYRRVVELIQNGVIGPVTEVHVWVGAEYPGTGAPTEIVPVPAHLHYDLWLGPAPYRPYHPVYLPFKWRNWWDFGGGTLADFGCHYMDLPFWALGLKQPKTVQSEGPAPHPNGPPEWQIVRYEFPSQAASPGVKLTWYQGKVRPPQFDQGLLPKWGNGVLFIGSQGMLIADYGKHQLLPESVYAGFQPPPPFIPDSIGHHKEWTEACKHGGGTTSNFEYAGNLTEVVLLGNVSHRLGGKLLEWDPVKLRATNCPEADAFIQHEYRRGWRL